MADRGRGSSEKKKKKLSKADKIFEKLKACSSHYMKKKKRHIICDLTRKHTAANIERNRKARAAYARRKQKRTGAAVEEFWPTISSRSFSCV